MQETEQLKLNAIKPIVGTLLAVILMTGGLIGCSVSKSKLVESSISSDSSDMIAQDSPDSGSAEHLAETSPASSMTHEVNSESGSASINSESESREVTGFKALCQYPELPNGCEITSLTAVLNYYEYDIDKTTLSDDYLPKAPVGQANFYREFVGDPHDEDAYGCYSPVVVNTANSYFSSVGSTMRARDISGSAPDELYALINEGKPVIVWATRYMEQGYYSVTWTVDGQSMTWYTPEHCLVLVGYDKNNGLVRLADPMVGDIVEYNMDLFEQRHAELKDQAVLIE